MKRVRASLPLEPGLPRFLGVEVILDRESHRTREVLSALADDKVVIGLLRYCESYSRRSSHTFDGSHASRLLPWPVHHARVELHDTLGVGQSAISHARVERIELDDVHSGDDCVENIRAAGNHRERFLDRGLRSAVLVVIAVAGGDY